MIGIVTSYDATEYFRRRGEDMMLVEDIETMLKEYVLAGFQNDSGDLDKAGLDLAVEEITHSNSNLRGPFRQALHQYLHADNGIEPMIDHERAEAAFSRHLNPQASPPEFEELTLNDYVELFLSKSRWDRYKSIFELDANSCRKLLTAVRNIRNELAHFRSQITAPKREQFRFCKDWLAKHQAEVTRAFAPTAENVVTPVTPENGTAEETAVPGLKTVGKLLGDLFKEIRLGKFESDDVPIQLAEPADSRESRYTPLALYLQSQTIDTDKVEMTFEEIEILIGGRLPRYARQHRSWWANDSTAHVQSIQWLGAGWRVSSVSMSDERVAFTRIREREQAYIQFFSSLLSDLRKIGDFPFRPTSPGGQSWISITRLAPESEAHLSIVGFSFTRGGRFRVELYIDEGDKDTNKRIFEELHLGREEVELSIGEELSWERLDQRRASRIAAYRPGAITDESDVLMELRRWAVTTMIKFYKVFRPMILQVRPTL